MNHKMGSQIKEKRKYRLAILSAHPIQYFSPLYRRLAQEEDIDLIVYYCSRQGLDQYHDPELGISLKWDIPLLEGYHYQFLPDIQGKVSSKSMIRSIQPAIFSEIIRGHYDALWVYSYKYPTYLLAMAAAKLSGTSLLLRTDSQLLALGSPAGSIKSKVRTWLLRLALMMFDGALAVGTSNAKYYRALGMPANKIFMVPFTVDNQLFMSNNAWDEAQVRAVRQQLGIPQTGPVILFVGKLIPKKEPLVLLKAFEKMQRQSNSPASLVFVGEGELRPSLERYCSENRLENVIFTGFVNQSQLNQYYSAGDVFVLLSTAEPWGLVLNEAMCAKKAVIVSDTVGAADDLVREGENGFTFQVGDVDALASHLTKLVSDQELCRKMGKRSLEIIQKWSFEEDVAGIREALSQLRRNSANVAG